MQARCNTTYDIELQVYSLSYRADPSAQNLYNQIGLIVLLEYGN